MKFVNRLWPLLAALLVVGLYSKLHKPPRSTVRPSPSVTAPAATSDTPGTPESASEFADTSDNREESSAPAAPFRCDGRTYCSQMNSCAEAKYFLEHCPNVKMDGDHDGVPCERQWCPNG